MRSFYIKQDSIWNARASLLHPRTWKSMANARPSALPNMHKRLLVMAKTLHYGLTPGSGQRAIDLLESNIVYLYHDTGLLVGFIGAEQQQFNSEFADIKKKISQVPRLQVEKIYGDGYSQNLENSILNQHGNL